MQDLPLTASEIASMRSTVNAHLGGAAIIYTRTLASNGAGGHTESLTAAGTVAARLAPISGREETVADRFAEVAHWVLTVPAETAIDETSQVSYGGRSYEVERIITRAPEELGRRVVVVEVR